MRRVRMLIYDGPEEWVETTKTREFVVLERELGEGKRIVSVELNPDLFELLELQSGGYSVQWKRESKYTDCVRPVGSPYEGQD